uniref:HPt domain-containing protein n=1 Tax=Phaeomonas parva TaxID=124430 RepID=A0A7S1UFI0_9STRA|mmetsp:Transcript_45811/g.143306  ORF Transcript_45811/g.143306 Transcript_45811/m.143306 type:complete len:151 (+) Transcript_45811:193-645(+)
MVRPSKSLPPHTHTRTLARQPKAYTRLQQLDAKRSPNRSSSPLSRSRLNSVEALSEEAITEIADIAHSVHGASRSLGFVGVGKRFKGIQLGLLGEYMEGPALEISREDLVSRLRELELALKYSVHWMDMEFRKKGIDPDVDVSTFEDEFK